MPTIHLNSVVAIVTGAAGGIGRAVVKEMKLAGATVIATDLGRHEDIDGADVYLQHDVGRLEDWQRVAEFAAKKFGRVDALVNNAGVALVEKFESISLEAWQETMNVNTLSVVMGVQTLLPLLKIGGSARQGGASIVNFSSIAGLRASPFNSAYCTSKAAVGMLTKCLGAEFARLDYNIRCNCVHPGSIETGMMFGIMDRYVEIGASPSRETSQRSLERRHPLGRLGRPEEMSGGVVYLCSDAASFVTCAEFLMDGGFTQV